LNAKEFLEQVRYVDRAIDSKLEQVERLRNETADMREKIARLEGLHGKGGLQWTSSER
jgi:hypothetical protein